jgi:hypothetical protein
MANARPYSQFCVWPAAIGMILAGKVASRPALLRRDFSHRISAQSTLTAALRILKAREMRYM